LGFHWLAASDEAATDQGALLSPDTPLPENTNSHADLAAIPAVFDAAAATLQHASQAHHVVLPVVRRTRADETTRVRPIFQGRTLVVSAAGAAGMHTLAVGLVHMPF
jgi:predicted amidohydrolase